MKRLSYLLPILLVACVGAEPHQDSGLPTPKAWVRTTPGMNAHDSPLVSAGDAKVEQQWWRHFDDPALSALINAAIAGNKNLASAKARVEEARANRGIAIANLLPQIDAKGSLTRENLGFLYNKPINLSEIDAQASWELDLFGKNQARAAAAKALVQSAEADRRGTMVALLADVSRSYFDLQNARRQIDILQRNLANQRKTLELTKFQFEGALLSDFDVQRAAAQVSATEAQLPLLKSAEDAAMNRLNILTGALPGQRDAQLTPPLELKPLDGSVLVIAPAQVLAARPDVQAAERRFAAAVSGKKAAVRELFPTISLGALFGVQDFTGGSARPWNIAANVTQPILHFGAIKAGIDVADAQKQQVFLNYQETVLEAVGDMEDALSAYLHETQRNTSLRDAAQQTRKAAELARLRFEDGDSDLLDVLVAEREALSAESNLASSDSDLRKDLTHIYTSAGGGWDVPPPTQPQK